MTSSSVPVQDVTVTITQPGGAVIVVNTVDGVTASTGDTISAVGDLVWNWSRPSPRDHMVAGSLEMNLRFAAPSAVALEARITVTLTAEGHTITLPAHWVESVTWTLRHAVWRYRIVAACSIARAAATKLASTPWPAGDDFTTRLDRINAASPMTLIDVERTAQNIITANEFYALAARDVDNATALDIITRTANTRALLVAAGREGIELHRQDANQLWWFGDRWALHVAASPTKLPAAAIESTTRTLTRRGMVTKVTVEYFRAGEAEAVTRTWTAPGRSSAHVSIDTDYWDSGVAGAEIDRRPIGHVASALIADPTPVPLLDEGRIMLGRVPGLLPDLATPIVSQQARITITDGPPDLDPYVAITAARLTVSGGRLRLRAALQPLTLTGTRRMRWSDWPDETTTLPTNSTIPRFRDIAGLGLPDPVTGGTDPTGPIRIRHTAPMFRPRYWA